jgi:hypothetical protein
MNERIKELVEQATTIVDTINSQGYSSSYANFDREKFAELIIMDIASKLEPVLASEILELYGVE